MTKLRKECREMARVEGNLRKTMEKAGFGDIARDLVSDGNAWNRAPALTKRS